MPNCARITSANMFFQLIATIFLVFATVEGTHLAPRMIGGKFVCSRKSFPYIVSMRTRGHQGDHIHFCAGVILDGAHFVTAASCFDDPQRRNLENLAIYYGSKIYSSNEGSYTTASKISIHPKYTRKVGSDDIAVVTVTHPFYIFDWSGEKTLERGAAKEGHEVVVAGWSAKPIRLQLKNLTLRIVRSDENCSANKSFFCAKAVTNGTVCHGDEGGPVVDFTEKPPKLVGIVPMISNDCISGKTQRITNIALYREFIDNQLGLFNFLKNWGALKLSKLLENLGLNNIIHRITGL